MIIMSGIERDPEMRALAQLMYFRLWDQVRDIFDDIRTQTILDKKNCTDDGNSNLLHIMLRFQPPLDLVISIGESRPWMFQQRDDQGRFPLHVASLHGSRSTVVKYLLSKYGDAATIKDQHGSLPLHLACRPMQWQPMEDDGFEEAVYIQPGSAVIDVLCKHSPQATHIEDCKGCNPIEIAFEQGLSKKICQILLESSNVAWKIRKSQEQADPNLEFSLPGYTHAAAMEFLKRCRSVKNLHEVCEATASTEICASNSFSLPPYSEMLKRYRSKQLEQSSKSQKNSRNSSISSVSSYCRSSTLSIESIDDEIFRERQPSHTFELTGKPRESSICSRKGDKFVTSTSLPSGLVVHSSPMPRAA